MVMTIISQILGHSFLVVYHDNFDDNALWLMINDQCHRFQDVEDGDDDDDGDDLVDDVLEGTGWAGLGRITDLGTL